MYKKSLLTSIFYLSCLFYQKMNGYYSDTSIDACDNDADEISSVGSYSSGWERSSATEYFDSTDSDDDFCANGEFYVPHKSSGKKVDVEYKCELVVLPNPYTKINTIQEDEEDTDDAYFVASQTDEVVEETKEPTTKNKGSKILVLPATTPQQDKPPLVEPPITNPWEEIDPLERKEEDCWKFLEKTVEKQQAPPRREKQHHHHHKEERDRRKPPQQRHTIDNSNTNKLCKYKGDCRMNRNNHCSMVHSLEEWKPRICRFNNGCKRKKTCGYYHTETPLSEYLRVMINIPDTIYAKNSSLYEKYL